MALCPLICAATATRDPLLVQCASLLLFAALALWFVLISINKHEKFYSIQSFPHLFLAILSVQLLARYTSLAASAAASWMLCSYLSTQILVLLLKSRTMRMRPAHALGASLSKVPRLLPRLTFLQTRGHTVFESFPSGDAAGGMVFSVVVATITKSPHGYLFAGLAAFGRMYLFAHHLLDVLAGCLIAFLCTTSLLLIPSRLHLEGGDFGVAEAVVTMLAFMVSYKKIVKTRVTLPRQWEAKNGEWHMEVPDEKEKEAKKS